MQACLACLSQPRGYPCCRFVYAFGGVGIFVFATAITGLVGAARSIRWCLNLYSTLVIVLLVAEGAMIVAYFADDSWQKRLPHDDTGEAKQVGRQ